jgi:eukaryotic-like serine/threonine-protein kinase
MKEVGKLKQCPHCGYLSDTPQLAPYLPVRAVLSNRYLVGNLLEYNGEGATYSGWDLTNKIPVSIREFLPDAIVIRTRDTLDVKVMAGCEKTFREGCQSFFEMWRQLARLRGVTALIGVLDIIEENSTAYAISEFFEGATLRDFLLKSKTGYIPWERARQLFMPVLSTIGTLHASGIIHRGISPTTLLIGKDGKLRIAGFCIWQARTATSELTPQLFNGYSAIEQYGNKGQQGPWTDIYAFGAVLYRSLIGSDPVDAPSRAVNDKLMIPGKFAEQIPAYVINALVNSLQIMPDDRTRSVELLRGELSASPSASAIAAPAPVPEKPAETIVPAVTIGKGKLKKEDKTAAFKSAAITFGAGILIFIILIATVWRDDFFGGAAPETTEESLTATTQAETVEVPNFSSIGTFIEIKTNALWADRFTFIADEVFSNEYEVGRIISQSVPSGTTVPKGTEITFQVSKGKEMILLPPGIVGMEYEAAKTLLTEAGFVSDKIDDANDGTKTAGTVSAVSPAVNQQYPKGTKVVMKVWGEPISTTAPAETEPETTP